jgi:undecaprenyl-phosphate 4-deoxy-4-formamido-L-arabinose transferase
MRNYGQHDALLCGILAARCETVVTMDDHLQHAPEDIPKLIAKFRIHALVERPDYPVGCSSPTLHFY